MSERIIVALIMVAILVVCGPRVWRYGFGAGQRRGITVSPVSEDAPDDLAEHVGGPPVALRYRNGPGLRSRAQRAALQRIATAGGIRYSLVNVPVAIAEALRATRGTAKYEGLLEDVGLLCGLPEGHMVPWQALPEHEIVAVRTHALSRHHEHVIAVELRDGTRQHASEVIAAIDAHEAHYKMIPPPGAPAHPAHAETGLPLLVQVRDCPHCGERALLA